MCPNWRLSDCRWLQVEWNAMMMAAMATLQCDWVRDPMDPFKYWSDGVDVDCGSGSDAPAAAATTSGARADRRRILAFYYTLFLHLRTRRPKRWALQSGTVKYFDKTSSSQNKKKKNTFFSNSNFKKNMLKCICGISNEWKCIYGISYELKCICRISYELKSICGTNELVSHSTK